MILFFRSVQVDHPLLKLVADIKFSIPAVTLSPNLGEILSHLMDVSSALLGVLRQVKWWLGPGAGKSLYEMMEVNGVVETLHSNVFQAIQGLVAVLL